MFLEEEFRHLQIQLKEIVSATDNFSPETQIGKGGFGPVYKGELSHPEGRNTVAIKRLDRRNGQGNPEFWKEVIMLSKCIHQNLVSLMHFCSEGDERILNTLSWIQRIKICLGAARGISYLHDPKETKQRVLHRDVKSSNILLDENWNAKLSDFGLSKVGPANQIQSFLVSNVVGTHGYCDPLYSETSLLTKECDVYSFGVVLFEVMCGRLCYKSYHGQLTILVPMWKKCFKEGRLDDIIFHEVKSQACSVSLALFSTIANRCLNRDHKDRPTMVEIVDQLERALLCSEQAVSEEMNAGSSGQSDGDGSYGDSSTTLGQDDGSYGDSSTTLGQDVIYPLKVSLEDLSNGVTIRCSISRKIICSTCNGEGVVADVKSTCLNGDKHLMNGFLKYKCGVCNGTRVTIIMHGCTECEGKKVVEEKEVVEVHVKKGMQIGQKFILSGHADQAPGIIPGDIVFVLHQKERLSSVC